MTSKLTTSQRNFWTILPILLLSACAQLPRSQSLNLVEVKVDQTQINYLDEDNSQAKSNQLSSDAYHMMVAELAFRNDDIDLAVENYLVVAKSQNNPDIAARAFRIALYGNDFGASLEAANRRLELAPNDIEAQQVIVVIYIRQKKIAKAVSFLKNVISNSQVTDKVLFGSLIGLFASEQDAKTTLDVTRQTAQNYPQKAYVQYMHAVLSAQSGQAEEALNFLDKSLEIEVIEGAYSSRSKILLKLGQTEEAVASLRQAVKDRPDDKDLGLTYARLLVDVKQYELARIEFEKLYLTSPDDPDLLYTLGLLSLESERLDDAQKYMSRLVTLNLREGEAQYYLGRIFEGKRLLNQAIERYRLVQVTEYRFDAQLRIAALLGATDRLKESREHLDQMRKGSQTQSSMVRIYITEGEILSASEQFDDALAVYNTALELSPSNIELLFARGMVAERVDRLDILEADIKAVLKVQPNNAHALNALGFTLADRTDRYEEAYDMLKRAAELLPNNAAILDSFGWVNYRMGNYDVAVRLLRSALSKTYDNEIAAHLVEVLWVSGNKEGAKGLWKEALRKAPNDPRIQQVIRRLTQGQL
ncbi:MAG: tetratricopeptide (TPR) repeat protein [Flavobacteriales bacterium]|jgi:tetratricopeptide (TPR) repeat protein